MRIRSLSHSVYLISRKFYGLMGARNRISAKWWGVKIGNGSRFIGVCKFRKYPGTAIKIGSNCTFYSKATANLIGINRPCIISTHPSGFNANIEIGNHCGFSGTVIGAFRNVKIGNYVRCGANTLITDSDWHLDDPRCGGPKEIIIGDNVWLGVNCVVLKGVTIGENSVIGANSVVVKSIPGNVVAAGNPCKVIKKLD